MKKILNNKFSYSIMILPTLLLSNADYSDDYFQKAINNYNNRLFQDSYIALKEYIKKDNLSENLKFILARSAYEVGKFDEAESLYKELLLGSPNSSRVKLELAQTYFQQRKFDKAKVLYEEVLKDSLTPNDVKRNIELTLNSLNRVSQKNFLKTTLGIGYGYDSNANNTSSDDFVFLGPLPLAIEDEKNDHVTEYILALNHTYKLKDDLTLDNKLVGFKQNYNKENNNDLSLAIIGTGLSYYQERYKISLAFDYNYIWLDDKAYLQNYVLTPSFEYKVDDNLIYKTKFRVIKKDFRQNEYQFRDSTYYEFQNSLALLTEKFGMNTFTLSLGTDNKDKGVHHNVDYNFGSLRYENLYNLTSSTMLSSAIEFYKEKYKEEEKVLYRNKKSNDKFIFDLGAIQSLSKNLSLGATFRYVNNNSNQNIYEYDKYIVKTNLYYSF